MSVNLSARPDPILARELAAQRFVLDVLTGRRRHKPRASEKRTDPLVAALYLRLCRESTARLKGYGS